MDRQRLIVAAASALISAAAYSQDVAPVRPTEVLTCHYAEGKGAADLDGLASGFNAWMERYEAPPYTAYVLSPLSHSSEIDFDLAWIGAWPDGSTMGASLDHYFTHGAELGPVFGDVMECGTNTNYAVLTVKSPPTPEFGPLTVSSCTLAPSISIDDALAAIEDWVDYAARAGSAAGHWILFPAYGERSDAAYDFKWAQGYASYDDFGRDYDTVNRNGAGRREFERLFTRLLRCDTPRSYAVRPIRIEGAR